MQALLRRCAFSHSATIPSIYHKQI
jgi:hypothetical protein